MTERGRLPLALILLSALACDGYTETLQNLWVHRDDKIEYTYKRHVQAYAYACVRATLAIVLGVIPKPMRAAISSAVGLFGRLSSIVVRTGMSMTKLAVIWGVLNATILAGAVALDTFGTWAVAAFIAWRTPNFIWRKIRVKVFHIVQLIVLPLLASTLLMYL